MLLRIRYAVPDTDLRYAATRPSPTWIWAPTSSEQVRPFIVSASIYRDDAAIYGDNAASYGDRAAIGGDNADRDVVCRRGRGIDPWSRRVWFAMLVGPKGEWSGMRCYLPMRALCSVRY